jgi:hypothetical protein
MNLELRIKNYGSHSQLQNMNTDVACRVPTL